jgi:2'-5' RNA ligase
MQGGPRARGVSLWLMPEGDARAPLAHLIARLAERFSTPPFPPHVTLLPGIGGREDDVLAVSAALAAGLRPFPVRLRGVDARDEPFRCLFVPALPDEPLVAAHAAASRRFGREPDPAFLPHLSLVYGSLPPETKGPLARELGAAVPGSIEAARLHVWRTEGPVEDWREVGTFPLGGGSRP